jgi:hypothetical protein
VDADFVTRGARTVVREVNPFALRTSVVALVALVSSCVVPSLLQEHGASLAPFLWIAVVFGWIYAVTPKRAQATVRVTAAGLSLQYGRASEVIAHGRIVSGSVVPADGAFVAGLELEKREARLIRCESRDEAEALLCALGVDPSRRRFHIRRHRIFHRLLAMMLAPAAAAMVLASLADYTRALGFNTTLPTLAVFTALTLLFAQLYPRIDITIGREGVYLRRRFGRRFFSWDDVADARPRAGGLDLVLRGGHDVPVWCNPDEAWVLPAVVDRIREARDAFHVVAGAGNALTALDRNGRDFAAWRTSLIELSRERGGGYRDQVLTRDQLRAVLADPAADTERRIAAAIALSHGEGPDGRTHVRVAADTAADPALREVLARVADHTEQEPLVTAALARDGAKRRAS